MNDEKYLKRAYNDAQQTITTPERLSERVLELLDSEEAVKQAREEMTHNNATPEGPTLRLMHRRAPFYAAAACLAVAALGFGAMHVASAPSPDSNSVQQSGASAALGMDFSIKAYADGTQTPLAAGDNGMVVFGRASDLSLATQEYATNGSYTGCLFRVEADGVKTVQAHISKGMLYRYDVRNATYESDAELLNEAKMWKPMARGLGQNLASYDMVSVGIASDGRAKDDPNKTYQVQTSKRLGQTAQLDYENGDAGAYFGLWTNEPLTASGNAGESNEQGAKGTDELGAIADTFEGAQLTVTVTFEDGRTSTQVIDLHSGLFAAQWQSESPDDMATLAIDPTLLDDASDVPEDAIALRTVYGEVASSNDEASPYASEPINEYANAVDEPMPLPETGEGAFVDEAQAVEVANRQSSFKTFANAEGDSETGDRLSGRESNPSLEVSNVQIDTADSLPTATPVEHTEIMRLGSLDYWNRIAQQNAGFMLGVDLRPSDDATIVHATFLIVNTASGTKQLHLPTAFGMGKLEGANFHLASVKASAPLMFLATKADGGQCGWPSNDILELAPGESALIDAYWEVRNNVLAGNDTAIGFGADAQPNVAVAIAL